MRTQTDRYHTSHEHKEKTFQFSVNNEKHQNSERKKKVTETHTSMPRRVATKSDNDH